MQDVGPHFPVCWWTAGLDEQLSRAGFPLSFLVEQTWILEICTCKTITLAMTINQHHNSTADRRIKFSTCDCNINEMKMWVTMGVTMHAYLCDSLLRFEIQVSQRAGQIGKSGCSNARQTCKTCVTWEVCWGQKKKNSCTPAALWSCVGWTTMW